MDQLPRFRVFVIAEAGVNHNGSLETAMRMVDAAAEAGADAVKFQTFSTDDLVTSAAPAARYQAANALGMSTQSDLLRSLELGESAFAKLARHCGERSVEFMSTPFGPKNLDLLVRVGIRRIKIPSGEIDNPILLVSAARTGKPVILSTGMSRLGDIELALGALALGYSGSEEKASQCNIEREFDKAMAAGTLKGRVTLMHCTTEYPAPDNEVNLSAIHTLSCVFGLPVGLSDHSSGTAIAVGAAALGAAVIEKHFTLDRTMPGPDHAASLEPAELRELVRGVRQVEAAIGSGRKVATPSERPNRDVARRSIVAAADIRKGETFTEVNLSIKRPGTGVSPMRFWDMVGRVSDRDYSIDEVIDP